MESEPRQEAAPAAAASERLGALGRLRAAFTLPLSVARWRLRTQSTEDARPSTPDSVLTFFSANEDESMGEVTLYPMDIDSELPGELLQQESSEIVVTSSPSTLGLSSLDLAPLGLSHAETETTVVAEIEEEEKEVLILKVDDEEVVSLAALHPPTLHRRAERQTRMMPVAPVAVGVVRCLCWVLAQKVVRQCLEKAVGASQRWLFANVCSRRTRLAIVGVFSVIWGILMTAVSVCALFVIIGGNLQTVIEETAQFGEWCDTFAMAAVACFLTLHVFQVLFGAFLISASKVSGYRVPEEEEESVMEKILLALFEVLKIDITTPPSAPCNHAPNSPSSDGDHEHERGSTHESPTVVEQPHRVPPPIMPPPLPFPSTHIGWVQPEEKEKENEGQKWPELPGVWSPPVFNNVAPQTPVNTPHPAPSAVAPFPGPSAPSSNFRPGTSNSSDFGPSNLPYPVPNNLPYPVPSNGAATTPGGRQPMGFQVPHFGFHETPPVSSTHTQRSPTIEVAKCTVHVQIISRQDSPTREDPAATEDHQHRHHPRSGPSPVPHKLMPWLYTSWMTLGSYALLSMGLAAVGRGAVAAVVGSAQVPAVACVMDVFSELRGVPESCGCKNAHKSAKTKKKKREVVSPQTPIRNGEPVFNETSPLLH